MAYEARASFACWRRPKAIQRPAPDCARWRRPKAPPRGAIGEYAESPRSDLRSTANFAPLPNKGVQCHAGFGL